ncbi:GNAT family N-acetyltransferase [Paenibacillus sp. JX-17]|uniref:GNAT family N-acetyltransferase n=1 Tax=Paenibacillus lacisoli TaxID=3064525 RepID=A0ABT9C8K1_9BACL|nr:GNAT family N-acetyltransferase [Paenibacillus sp. JX-17]MDO7905551.1 GNAT family N-acetyltransferase [Paenibacillus sp. JX-17]
MKNPLKEIKNNMDQMKQSMDGIKGSVNDVKQDVDDVKKNVQGISEQAKDTSGELKDGIARIKGEVQETKEIVQETRHTLQGKPPLEGPSAGSDGIEMTENGTGFVCSNEQGIIGEITYVEQSSTDVWILDHTYVSPEHRGGQIAKQLLDHVVAKARTENKKILPACSYALAQFKRHSEYEDVWYHN